ncbi:hypothetical protein AVEN_53156-1 [Araneus ventricosus]|uniref:Uncharacterized protein n=1 Tax=Araneus ventricosus TaxID=182803 RepID=A0A4Y2ABP5_ARAVE|nr:hypothetical protein AVEN_53156-1 [Araneus ventricosus]
MNKDEKMKILDDTIHSLKISNSQNLEDFKLEESNITSPHQKTCWRIGLFDLKFQRKKKNIKNDKLPEGPKAPRRPNGPGTRSCKYTSFVQRSTKEF